MIALENKRVLVLGLGRSGIAAVELLRRRRARIVAVDSADTPALRKETAPLKSQGVMVELGAEEMPEQAFDLAVISPGVPWSNAILQQLNHRKVPILGEFELGYQHSLCLNVAITGTNGKTTTTELVERILTAQHLKTLAAGNIGVPVCSVADQTKDLDFLTLEASSFQLETIRFFRPAIGVLLNITPDHLDR